MYIHAILSIIYLLGFIYTNVYNNNFISIIYKSVYIGM